MSKNTTSENWKKPFLSFNYNSTFSPRSVLASLSVLLILIIFISLLSLAVLPSASGVSKTVPSEYGLRQETVEADFEFVRGYFNEINYTGSSEETSIELSHPDEISYNWTFSEGEWSGYLDYIHEDKTYYSEEESRWFVSLAIDDDVPADDDWTLSLDEEDHRVKVVEPNESFSVSGSLGFNFEPNTEDAQATSDSITIENKGNVPMSYELIYQDENMEHSRAEKPLELGESANPIFYYNYSTGGAEMVRVEFSIQRKVVGVLDLEADDSHQVKSREEISRDFDVVVGYEGYDQGGRETYSIQYKSSISLRGDTTETATFYIYPEEQVLFDVESDNVSFDEEDITITIHNDDDLRDVELPQQLDPDHGEVELTIEFESHRENDGYIDLIVDGDIYTTSIHITDPAQEADDAELTFIEEEAEAITLGIVLVGGVAVYIGGRIWLSKKDEGEEDEEEKEKKEEKEEKEEDH